MTKTEQKRDELFQLLLDCGYNEINAAVCVDNLCKREIRNLADYNWYIDFYKWIYGDMLVKKGLLSKEEHQALIKKQNLEH